METLTERQIFSNAANKKRNNNIKIMGKYNDVKNPYSEIDILLFPHSPWKPADLL